MPKTKYLICANTDIALFISRKAHMTKFNNNVTCMSNCNITIVNDVTKLH